MNSEKFERIKADDTKSAHDKLLAMTQQVMLESGSDDFAVNFSRVCRAEPELHQEYLNSNGSY